MKNATSLELGVILLVRYTDLAGQDVNAIEDNLSTSLQHSDTAYKVALDHYTISHTISSHSSTGSSMMKCHN